MAHSRGWLAGVMRGNGGNAMNSFQKRFAARPAAVIRRAFMACVLVAAFACVAAFTGCGAKAVVDQDSPRQQSFEVRAGSDLTEESQYVEARIGFDAPLETEGDAAADLEVLVNGQEPDSHTMRLEVFTEGSQLVVRLVPADGIDGGSGSLYFAVYDGLVQVHAVSDDGALPHVRWADGQSNAVLDQDLSFTVPSGVQLADVQARAGTLDAPAQVSFRIAQTAQLRSCTWLYFGEGFPVVRLHDHDFAHDLPQTCAARLVSTVNEVYGEELQAVAQGDYVTVSARTAVEGQLLCAVVVEGPGVSPAEGAVGDVALAAAGVVPEDSQELA